jgi:hypothetical protein
MGLCVRAFESARFENHPKLWAQGSRLSNDEYTWSRHKLV